MFHSRNPNIFCDFCFINEYNNKVTANISKEQTCFVLVKMHNCKCEDEYVEGKLRNCLGIASSLLLCKPNNKKRNKT